MSAPKKQATQGDARVRRSANPRTSAASRADRGEEDQTRAASDGTAMTAEERAALIRTEMVQSALPTPPAIPGWHLCWLSTTSPYDPIHKRMRLGYVPVKPNELPGFSGNGVSAVAEIDGMVACNEMRLFKVPAEMYESIMQEFHHNLPREEEAAIRARLIRDEEDSSGKRLGEIPEDADGFRELVKQPKQGVFAA